MKLYLSSYHLGNNPQQLKKIVGKNKKAAIIPNALDFATDMSRLESSIKREISDLEGLGFEAEKFDLKKYFGKPAALEKDLSKFGLVWVIGGNAFLLRRSMQMSGFDKWLQKAKKNNKDFVYGGFSAGSCVLAPSLKGLEIVDDPKVTAKGYRKKVIWDGVGILDWAFVPHYKSDHPESAKINELVEYYTDNKIVFKAFRDGEALVSEF